MTLPVIELFSGPADVEGPHDALDNLHVLRAIEEGCGDDSLNGISDRTGGNLVPLRGVDVNALCKSSGETLLDEIGIGGLGLEDFVYEI
jgi:hypothetical protein